MSKGVIFKYVEMNGITVTAVALNDEQHPQLSNYGKVFLRILDDDYNFKKTKEGKGIIAVKYSNVLIKVGLWD